MWPRLPVVRIWVIATVCNCVELAIAASGEAVSGLVGAGDFDRGCAGITSERGRVGESAGTSSAPDETACSDRAYADGAGQGAARSCNELADLLGVGLEHGVDGTDLGD
jgi:hypothetical protein